jgi:ribose 5-phosphate isomerase A
MSIDDFETVQALKTAVGKAAAERVHSGMRIGLGSGSTAAEFISQLGQRVRTGELIQVRGVATSYQSKGLARENEIPILPLAEAESLDLVVDGADEVDPALNLIKGGGAAHTREKIVASMAKEFIVVVDSRKLVDQLGSRFPVPVEILPNAYRSVIPSLRSLGGEPTLRMAVQKAGPVITDQGNFVIDVRFDRIDQPKDLERELNNLPGVLDNGLFVGLATSVLVADLVDGKAKVREIHR